MSGVDSTVNQFDKDMLGNRLLYLQLMTSLLTVLFKDYSETKPLLNVKELQKNSSLRLIAVLESSNLYYNQSNMSGKISKVLRTPLIQLDITDQKIATEILADLQATNCILLQLLNKAYEKEPGENADIKKLAIYFESKYNNPEYYPKFLFSIILNIVHKSEIDLPFSNQQFANQVGMVLPELNTLEAIILAALDYNLGLTKAANVRLDEMISNNGELIKKIYSPLFENDTAPQSVGDILESVQARYALIQSKRSQDTKTCKPS